VRNLPSPPREQARHHLVVALKQYLHAGVQHGYAVSTNELDDIISMYDHYDALHGMAVNALKGGELAEDLRDAVAAGYRFIREGMKLGAIRAMLSRGIDLCPICGISYPGELDHYLPKSSFKPLAIYVRNLVPHCHECNKHKSAVVGTNAEERFIHAYLELLPDVQFLIAKVSLAGRGLNVEFGIAVVEGLPPEMYTRLANQFRRLKLNARYGRELNTYMTGLTVALHMAFENNQGEGVRTFLLRQAAVERMAYYRNHWRPVLLSALAEHDAFCAGGFADVLPMGQDIVGVAQK
jgi:hypothetical protein